MPMSKVRERSAVEEENKGKLGTEWGKCAASEIVFFEWIFYLVFLWLPPPLPLSWLSSVSVCLRESVWMWWHHAVDWESMLFMGVHILIERQTSPLIIIPSISLCLPPSLYAFMPLCFPSLRPSHFSLPPLRCPHPHLSPSSFPFISTILPSLVSLYHFLSLNLFSPFYSVPVSISSSPISQSITRAVNSQIYCPWHHLLLTLHRRH